MASKLKQIIFDLRHQPVVAWVTLIATALTIFLIMLVVMIDRVPVTPFAPESCRDRLMVGMFFHYRGINGYELDNSGSLGYDMARRLYDGLDGVERVSYSSFWNLPAEIMTDYAGAFDVNSRPVDAEFFNIFDHTLIAGRYFTDDEVKSDLPLAVVSESVARRALGSDRPIGRSITINMEPYRIVGIVKDNSPLATIGGGEVFIPMSPDNPDYRYSEYGGAFSASLLVKEGVDFADISKQVKSRYSQLEGEMKAENFEPVYHGQPYDVYTIASGLNGSNGTPNPGLSKRIMMVIYAVLLLVPAINLGSMLHSRIRRRISEFGVRRAYGCSRARLIRDIVVENFFITLAGGAVGLVLGLIAGATYSGLYETADIVGSGATPALTAIFNWQIIAIAVTFCFILNIISASIPAWIASRLNVVGAINTK